MNTETRINQSFQDQIDKVHADFLYLPFYMDLLDQNKTQLEGSFILNQTKICTKASILDLACGHGRHSIYFAEKGFSVTGIDRNKAFIKLAQSEAKSKGLVIEFRTEDIFNTQADLQEKFGLCVLLYNSLCFFNPSFARKLLKIIWTYLLPGGNCFLDIRNGSIIPDMDFLYDVSEKGNNLMIDRIRYDARHKTTTNDRIYIVGNQRYDAPFTMYNYDLKDLENMAIPLGFEIEKVFGSWSGEKYVADSKRILLQLKKKMV